MSRQSAARLGVLLAALILTFVALQASVGQTQGSAPPPAAGASARAGASGQTLAPPVPAVTRPLALPSPAVLGSAGAVVTQSFALKAGWNAIYLEVEPFNTSPLVDPDGSGPLPAAPVSSTLEAVFSKLPCAACLESVWTWNVPHSRMDYIIDPSDGLWDPAGWRRYFPAGSLGPDGLSQGFLSDMVSLHGSTGYLVRLKDGTGDVTLTVAGTAPVRALSWLPGSYNLSGFPVLPATGLKVSTLKATSPITDVRRLNSDGRWGASLAATASLNSGEAYLVYYSDQTPGAATDYTAPLNLRGVPGAGLSFTRGAAGARQSLTVDNLFTATASLTVSLASGGVSPVILQLTQPVTKDLSTGPAVFSIPARGSALLTLYMPPGRQLADGEGLLELSSSLLGTRRLIPVAAKGGSMAGLWVGEVVANDVSESRLGSTNVPSGSLTIALGPRDNSGIPGAAEMLQVVSGSTSKVVFTVTLSLPSAKTTTPPQAVAGTSPYVGGYAFVDVNRNGQRDADETGIGGVAVTLTPADEAPLSTATQADGSYVFQALAAGTYTLSLPASVPGYTSTFNLVGQSASSSLVGRWAFDEGGGLTAFDSSGYGNNGRLMNGAAYTREIPTGVTYEDPSSLTFDYVDDYVTVAASPAFSTPTFTVAAWIKGSAWGPTRYSNTVAARDGTNRGWSLRSGNYNGNAWLSFVVGTGTGWVELTTPYVSQMMRPNTWYHVAGSYDGAAMRMFINGAEIRSTAVLTYASGSTGLNIGRAVGTANYFNGLIDDVRVYDRGLSSAELTALMSQGLSPNRLPVQVTVDSTGVTEILPTEYKPQTLPPPYQLPAKDAAGNHLEPLLNFGMIPVYDASLWTGTCSDRLLKQASLGQVVNGYLAATLTSAALNQPPAPVTHQLLGGAQQYAVYVEQAGADGAEGQGVACGEIVVGAPAPNPFRFRVILRVGEDGRTSLLPTYTITGEQRVSSAAFSMPGPIAASGRFTDANPALAFTIVIGADDPLNPFRHKYAPDHDNLDAQFNPIDLNAVPPYLWESYQVRRDLTLELTQFPPGGGADEATDLDWGGVTWGGWYREVIKGLHKNDITVKGYFAIRRVLTGSELRPQAYDLP